MTVSAFRIAEQYLQAVALLDPGDDQADVTEQISLMNRLISKGEARRLGRTSDIRLINKGFDGDRVWAKIQGTTGRYDTRITVRPRPGHHCTCIDWQRNGARVGPCKHVLHLAEVWLDILIDKLEKM